jgi:hypothetical protein
MEKTVDGSKRKIPQPVAYVRKVISLDEETRHDKLDRLVLKIFPSFLLACAVLIAFLTIYLDNYTFMGVIFAICVGFVLGFMVLGAVCLILSDRGVISERYVILAVIIIPLVFTVLMYPFGAKFGFSDFIVNYFEIFQLHAGIISFLIGIYTITIVVFLVAYGVVSVIAGYFRSYFYRVLRSLEAPPEKRKNHIPEWLFQIPDIIDIRTVEFEPEPDDGKFNKGLFRNTALSIFVLGIVICSFLFINPLFLEIITFDEMLLTGMLLSMFISPLVIPWSIVKSIGAKITSDAPRDFYLWKGMRKRLYEGFFTVTIFLMLIVLSLYLGMDFSRIAVTYIAYITFIGLIAIVTSFVYVNVFYRGFKNGIIKSYNRSKEE